MGSTKRFQHADRSVLLSAMTLDEALDEMHPVRAVWRFIEQLPLSAFYREIQTDEHSVGRSPVDPKILLALWVWASKEGISSARFLNELCQRDVVYRWICGGVGVNYHLLAHFRVAHGAKFDKLLVRILGVLTKHGLVTLQRVCQDGTRVRASAGTASFRRESTLKECLREAQEHLKTLRAEHQKDPTSCSRAARAARERAVRERTARVEAALREVPSLQEARTRRVAQADKKLAALKDDEVRVSTTDPEARIMKMADGGFRPAYNIQLVADEKTDVIAGVLVSNIGQDSPLLIPALDDLHHRTHLVPREELVDGAYVEWGNLVELERRGVTVFAPVRVPRNPRVDPFKPKPSDPPAVARWRKRMPTKKAKSLYKRRGATSERINADMKEHRNLRSVPVRGLKRVTAVVLLNVLAFDIDRCIAEGWLA